MQAIILDNVSFDYKQYEGEELHAVKGVSLSIEEGDFVVLAGANGSGKSTLAKMMNALLLPTSGKVRVFGIDTADKERVFDIRKNVGMVFQNPDNQMVASIVEDDIAFGPENLGVPRKEIIERVNWALSSVGMLEYKNAAPFKMSGGQKQRVAIAGILAIKPKVLILDEATSMLDPKGRREVMSVLKHLNRDERITVVHITHHMEEVTAANRVVVMHEGKIVMDDSPRNIFSKPDEIRKYKLELPIVGEIAELLNNRGIDVGQGVLTEEELLEGICRLA